MGGSWLVTSGQIKLCGINHDTTLVRSWIGGCNGWAIWGENLLFEELRKKGGMPWAEEEMEGPGVCVGPSPCRGGEFQ